MMHVHDFLTIVLYFLYLQVLWDHVESQPNLGKSMGHVFIILLQVLLANR